MGGLKLVLSDEVADRLLREGKLKLEQEGKSWARQEKEKPARNKTGLTAIKNTPEQFEAQIVMLHG